jgi:F0F1-type ATP synthase membrane subunit b/b'
MLNSRSSINLRDIDLVYLVFQIFLFFTTKFSCKRLCNVLDNINKVVNTCLIIIPAAFI